MSYISFKLQFSVEIKISLLRWAFFGIKSFIQLKKEARFTYPDEFLQLNYLRNLNCANWTSHQVLNWGTWIVRWLDDWKSQDVSFSRRWRTSLGIRRKWRKVTSRDDISGSSLYFVSRMQRVLGRKEELEGEKANWMQFHDTTIIRHSPSRSCCKLRDGESCFLPLQVFHFQEDQLRRGQRDGTYFALLGIHIFIQSIDLLICQILNSPPNKVVGGNFCRSRINSA